VPGLLARPHAAPVPAVIVRNDEVATRREKLGDLRVPERMLSHTMGDLHDAARRVGRLPAVAAKDEAVRRGELEGLGLGHASDA